MDTIWKEFSDQNMADYKTVIFDIGGVLTDYMEREFYVLRGYSQEMADRLCRATMRSGYWDEFDLGRLGQPGIISIFQQQDPEIADEIRAALQDVSLLVKRRASAIPWIQSLKEDGYNVLYLSNFAEQAHRQCSEALDFVGEMDGGIFSFQCHLVKPDPAIYQLLINQFQLQPESCVYIDDTAKNLLPAGKLGMQTIQYLNQEQAERELNRLLGRCDA